MSLTGAMTHRGPDDEGCWFSPDNRTGLGHRRLSILDLSPLGHQPMLSPDSRYALVFNGEIYNFRELRAELERTGERFISNSDTEILLRLWSLRGPACLLQLRGMYAFAIWDDSEHLLWLARDPLGIKPLYYVDDGDRLTFSSEVKALKAVGLAGQVDAEGVGAFLRWGSIPAPLTIYSQVRALPPGTFARWRQHDGQFECESYWDYDAAWVKALELVHSIETRVDAIEWVRNALLNSVRDHLVSDVPVGTFLSGGIDSTAVVSLMRRAGQSEIESFSITFDDPALDESRYAEIVARFYDTHHSEWRVSAMDFEALRPDFFTALDQPTIDGFNTFLVSRLAHAHGLKVVTSGVGGDELFRGYPVQFQKLPTLFNVVHTLPEALRGAGATLVNSRLSHAWLGKQAGRVNSLLQSEPELRSVYMWSRELFRPGEVQALLSDYSFAEAASRVNMADYLPSALPTGASLQAKITMLETNRYLGSQLLADSDNFSMTHSLELRVPLVDRVLLEQVIALRDTYFTDAKNTPKALLVAAVGDMPDEIVYRKKQGFTLPFARWLATADWQPISDILDRTGSQRLAASTTHWSRRWALEVLDAFLLGS